MQQLRIHMRAVELAGRCSPPPLDNVLEADCGGLADAHVELLSHHDLHELHCMTPALLLLLQESFGHLDLPCMGREGRLQGHHKVRHSPRTPLPPLF